MIVNFECGHTMSVAVEGRERKKMRENPGICPDCIKANIAKANVAAAKQADEAGLPVLTGSPKQVAWATTIRADMLKTIEKEAKTEEEKELCKKFVIGITDASRLINARHVAYKYEVILNQAKQEVK